MVLVVIAKCEFPGDPSTSTLREVFAFEKKRRNLKLLRKRRSDTTVQTRAEVGGLGALIFPTFGTPKRETHTT